MKQEEKKPKYDLSQFVEIDSGCFLINTEDYLKMENEIKQLKAKLEIAKEALRSCEKTLNCLGEKFEPDWNIVMAEAGVRGVALISLSRLRAAIKEIGDNK